MKAVVIIDLPDNVKWEEIEDVIVDVWIGEKTFIRKYKSMQRGVEIKPLPSKLNHGNIWSEYDEECGYIDGWNACLDELLGEEE